MSKLEYLVTGVGSLRTFYFITCGFFVLLAFIKIFVYNNPLYYVSSIGLAVCYFASGLLETKKRKQTKSG
ncbi:hypothetical protein [Alkalicoccobacillus murimartini]|uniref:Flp pilus assembly protein TadB n=1 Tax=Alkalicoccobacillus murimartini TaxID=171685 RepID=A0ABT9YE82_9BACI|nr:hypothetical protein [Alkalicoccobacillus murimartini]MDQ0206147.1 Flp pilus assembly protein TadB [Alkalicoccobacillus murimartini]